MKNIYPIARKKANA